MGSKVTFLALIISAFGLQSCLFVGSDLSEDEAICNNGVLEPGEACDTNFFAEATCQSLFPGTAGSLTCSSTCEISAELCISETCGNGAVEIGEECEKDVPLANCSSLGFASGDLTCNFETCKFDKSKCVEPVCGNGILEPGEECDFGAQGSPTEETPTCADLELGSKLGTLSPSCDASCKFTKEVCDVRTLSSGEISICALDNSLEKPVQCWGARERRWPNP